MGEQRDIDERTRRLLWRVGGIGSQFALTVGGLTMIGWLIDRWQGSFPTWSLVGALLGLAGGGYNFFRTILDVVRRLERDERQRKDGRDAGHE